MNDEIVQALREFLAKHGATFDDEKRRLLRARLADSVTLGRGRAAILVAAAEDGVPKLLENASPRDVTQSISSLGDQLAIRRHILPREALWAVRLWAAALDLIDASQVSKPAPAASATTHRASGTPRSTTVARPSGLHAPTIRGRITGWLTTRQKRIVARIQRVAALCWLALHIILLLFIPLGTIAGVVIVIILIATNDSKPLRPKQSVPIARNKTTEIRPPAEPPVETERSPEVPALPDGANTETTITPGLIGTAARIMLSRNLPLSSSQSNKELVWGDRGSLPHSVALNYAQMVRGQDQRADNELRRQAELANVRSKLQSLLSSLQGQHVKARMAVAGASHEELILNADVSWGWPTEDLHSFSPQGALESWAPRHGLVRLVSGSEDASDTVPLRFGSDVPTSLIGRLHWNDKVLVEFDVLAALDQGLSSERPVRVQVQRLKFIAAESTFRWTDVWPAHGTFPDQISAFASWSYKERRIGGARDFESFLTYANQSLKSGRAKLRVLRVTESSIELSNDVTAPAQGRPGMVYLVAADDRSSELSLPIAALGRERASRLTKDSALLVAFEVVSVQEGSVLVPGRFRSELIAGVEVAIRNLRLSEGS